MRRKLVAPFLRLMLTLLRNWPPTMEMGQLGRTSLGYCAVARIAGATQAPRCRTTCSSRSLGSPMGSPMGIWMRTVTATRARPDCAALARHCREACGPPLEEKRIILEGWVTPPRGFRLLGYSNWKAAR